MADARDQPSGSPQPVNPNDRYYQDIERVWNKRKEEAMMNERMEAAKLKELDDRHKPHTVVHEFATPKAGQVPVLQAGIHPAVQGQFASPLAILPLPAFNASPDSG